MYTSTSKQQEGCTFKDSHPKCFITTNFDEFHREAVAKGAKSRWSFDSVFPCLDRVESLMFQNLLEPASNNTTR